MTARNILRRYVGYQLSVKELDVKLITTAGNDQPSVEQLARRHEALKDLQNAYFTLAENDVFFQEKDVLNPLNLEQHGITQDVSLKVERQSIL